MLPLVVTATLLASHAIAEPEVSALQVEAAFLRNFARYVGWPRTSFRDDGAAWRVCVAGREDVVVQVTRTLLGRREQGRPFEVVSLPEEVASCHLIFLAAQDPATRKAVLEKVKSLAVLTVGDTPNFLEEGGVVRFQVGSHVEFSVNLDQARAVGLQFPTRVLEVSREVLENGRSRKVH